MGSEGLGLVRVYVTHNDLIRVRKERHDLDLDRPLYIVMHGFLLRGTVSVLNARRRFHINTFDVLGVLTVMFPVLSVCWFADCTLYCLY